MRVRGEHPISAHTTRGLRMLWRSSRPPTACEKPGMVRSQPLFPAMRLASKAIGVREFFSIFPEPYKLLTKSAQLTASENIGYERPCPALSARGAVNSPSRITLGNKGNFRPLAQTENQFSRATGGGNGTGIGRSPAPISQIFHSPAVRGACPLCPRLPPAVHSSIGATESLFAGTCDAVSISATGRGCGIPACRATYRPRPG